MTRPLCVEIGCTESILQIFGESILFGYIDAELAHIHKMAGNRRCGGHDGAYQMRAAALALASFEVAVRGAGTALALGQHVVVHADAHAAARITPFESGIAEYAVEPLRFRFGFD